MEGHKFLPNIVAPENWAETPIVLENNPFTGVRDADDVGGSATFRDVTTLKINPAPLVEPDNIEIRPSSKGIDEFGDVDASLALPGGIEGKGVVRETVARGMEYIAETLREYFGEQYRLVMTDGYRPLTPQITGYKNLLNLILRQNGITDPSHEQLIHYGRLADTTMAWVKADKTSEKYGKLLAELKKDKAFMDDIKGIVMASKKNDEQITKMEIEDLIFDYITISTNSGIGRAADRAIPLDNENNPHAGGGTVDVILVDSKGSPLNHVSAGYAGPEANLLYLENDDNFSRFLDAAFDPSTDPNKILLQKYVRKLGYADRKDFTKSDWNKFKIANRVRFYAFMALGGTTWNPDSKAEPEHEVAGENWHFKLPRTLIDRYTGKFIFEEPQTKGYSDLSGSACQTLLRVGEKGIAVWGAASADKYARTYLGLP